MSTLLLLFALTAPKHYDAGMTRSRANDCAAAVAEFAASEQAAEPAPERDFHYGVCLAKLERWDAAAERLRAYADSHAADPRGWYWLAQAELYRKRFSEARDAIARSLTADPQSPGAFRTLGEIELQLRNYDAAYHAWLSANRLDPKDARTTYYLGRLFQEADFLNEAAAWFRQTLALDPRHFAAMTYLAVCAEHLNMPDTALQLYAAAVRESKDRKAPFSWAFLNYAKLLRQTGKDKEALALLEEGAALCPEGRLLTQLGLMLAADDPARAETVLRRAIEMDAGIPDAHYRLGILLRMRGQSAEAQAEMQRFQEAKSAEERNKVKIQAVRRQP